MIEFFDKDEDYKPIRLGGSSPAAKLFLTDLKVRVYTIISYASTY